MQWLWMVAVTGWILAVAALAVSRRLSRRLSHLTEQYWELKYEHGELKARVRALAPTPEEQVAAAPAVQQTFVSLDALRGSKRQ